MTRAARWARARVLGARGARGAREARRAKGDGMSLLHRAGLVRDVPRAEGTGGPGGAGGTG